MADGSSITVNNGGNLYAYGFITGSGSVTAKNGSTIYECLQFEDCRGGSQMTDMKNEVFPISQYYVQNIEVPVTYESGANEYAFTTVFMSKDAFPAKAKFIGSSGMFNMSSGSVTKQYNGAADRLEIVMNGSGTLAGIALDVGTTNIDSKKYDLALNSNITVTIGNGSTATISQDIAVLPGSKIIIEETAAVNLTSGKNLYVYDADEWGNFCYSKENVPFRAVGYAPGRTYTRTEADLVDAEIILKGSADLSAGNLYTTAGGANISGGEGATLKIKPY